jgi:hypothetical protein
LFKLLSVVLASDSILFVDVIGQHFKGELFHLEKAIICLFSIFDIRNFGFFLGQSVEKRLYYQKFPVFWGGNHPYIYIYIYISGNHHP